MTSSFLSYSAENSLNGTVVPAANCSSLRCTKKKAGQQCMRQSDGTYTCEATGTSTDTCYEDFTSDSDCKAIDYLSCASTPGYPDCA